jgi:hypothetical protein
VHSRSLALLIAWVAASATSHAEHPCEAETAPLMTMTSSWESMVGAADALPKECFDGYFAEGISDTIVRKMRADWPGFLKTLDSHPQNKKFLHLVLISLNATLDPGDIQAVNHFALSSCPSKYSATCSTISQRAKAALAAYDPPILPQDP